MILILCLKVEEVSRRRARKATKFQRAIVGVSADEVCILK